MENQNGSFRPKFYSQNRDSQESQESRNSNAALHDNSPTGRMLQIPFSYGSFQTPTSGYGSFQNPMSGMMPPPYACGPWMQFLNGTPMPQMRSQSSPMSGTPRSLSFEIPSSEASGGSKRVAREQDEEVSSPSKKLNQTVKVKKAGNIMWDDELDDFLIPFLANEARNGGKCDKSMRKCGKNRYLDMRKCHEISGAGWDEETKTITLDPSVYSTWARGLTKMSGNPSRSRSRRIIQRGDLHRQVRERRRDLESTHVATSVPSIGEFTPVRDVDANRQTPTDLNDLQTTPFRIPYLLDNHQLHLHLHRHVFQNTLLIFVLVVLGNMRSDKAMECNRDPLFPLEAPILPISLSPMLKKVRRYGLCSSIIGVAPLVIMLRNGESMWGRRVVCTANILSI
ncbi:uncharacterized protein LOC109844690 isoform X3 [Asparagus officinalis]|nr:uncharacterized protein LOC109844690 isoform X3 [Asparagus officinalis]